MQFLPIRTSALAFCPRRRRSTLLLLLLQGSTLYIANVGDSRAVLAETKGGRLVARDLSWDQTPFRCARLGGRGGGRGPDHRQCMPTHHAPSQAGPAVAGARLPGWLALWGGGAAWQGEGCKTKPGRQGLQVEGGSSSWGQRAPWAWGPVGPRGDHRRTTPFRLQGGRAGPGDQGGGARADAGPAGGDQGAWGWVLAGSLVRCCLACHCGRPPGCTLHICTQHVVEPLPMSPAAQRGAARLLHNTHALQHTALLQHPSPCPPLPPGDSPPCRTPTCGAGQTRTTVMATRRGSGHPAGSARALPSRAASATQVGAAVRGSSAELGRALEAACAAAWEGAAGRWRALGLAKQQQRPHEQGPPRVRPATSACQPRAALAPPPSPPSTRPLRRCCCPSRSG